MLVAGVTASGCRTRVQSHLPFIISKSFSSSSFPSSSPQHISSDSFVLLPHHEFAHLQLQPYLGCWNRMIKEYCRQGQTQLALQLFHRMQWEGLLPDRITFVSILSVCVSLAALKKMHVVIIGSMLNSDVVVGTALVSRYGKCDSLNDARAVFGKLPWRDVVSWNAMITVYIQHGQSKCALQLFRQMHRSGVMPNKITFVIVLDACASEVALAEGEKVHRLIVDRGMLSDVVTSNALINMYGKCGSVEAARMLFDRMHERSIVSWNTMIAVYAQNQQRKEAHQLFQQMEKVQIMPDKLTFINILSAVSNEAFLAEAQRIHDLIILNGFYSDIELANSLISMYGKCSSPEDARSMFENMGNRDIISWNAIITAHTQNSQNNEAFDLFDEMQLEGVIPDKVTFLSILSACTSQANLEKGEQIYVLLLQKGFASEIVLGNALVQMYGNCGSVKDAHCVFGQMCNHDVVSWNNLIAAYAHNGEGKEALQLFDQIGQEGIIPNNATFASVIYACTSQSALLKAKQIHALFIGSELGSHLVAGTALVKMYGTCGRWDDAWTLFDRIAERDIVLWTSVIAMCIQNGKGDYAIQLFEQMLQEGALPNKITVASILDACANQAALPKGRQMHACIMGSGCELDVVVESSLINMYGKCGNLEDAQRLFDTMTERNVISWNTMIAAFARNGQGKAALEVFAQMQNNEISPDNITFINLLNSCSHSGLVDEGFDCFISMKQNHGLKPAGDHYNCMIDVLGRAGRLDEAEDLLKNIPFQTAVVSLMSLLRACGVRRDVERGERIAEQLFELALCPS